MRRFRETSLRESVIALGPLAKRYKSNNQCAPLFATFLHASLESVYLKNLRLYTRQPSCAMLETDSQDRQSILSASFLS